MMRSYKNKKWFVLPCLAVLILSLLLPLFNNKQSVHAEEGATSLNVSIPYEGANKNAKDYGGFDIIWNGDDEDPTVWDEGSSISFYLGAIDLECSDYNNAATNTNKQCYFTFGGNGKQGDYIYYNSDDSAGFFAAAEQVLKDVGSFQSADGARIDFSQATFQLENKTDPEVNPGDPNNYQTGENNVQDRSSGKSDCLESEAMDTLGWIVCPILEWMGDTANKVYNDFLEPALQVEPQLFTGTGNATYDGWETFRNMGNIAMVILLMVVIFSQVTGVGIDNYGIKKILPKLIIAAILMNLSYWICVAVVDVSNIIGNGVQAMFNGFAERVTMPAELALEGTSEGISLGGVLPTAISVGLVATLVGAAGFAAFGTITSGGIGGIIMMLLLTAISVIVSIVTLFIVLAARQVAIVVLIVISPLAMVCYMLPNTKGLFDKWMKSLQALLMVYPIAGFMVAGGNYVSALLLSNTSISSTFFGAFTAMIAGIVPIFFIPSVLRKSMTVAGDIGGKITNFGRGATRAGRGLANAADRGRKSTEDYKQRQQLAAQRRVDRYAEREKRRLNGRPSLTKVQEARLAKANEILNAKARRERENEMKADSLYNMRTRRQQRVEDNIARDKVMAITPEVGDMMERKNSEQIRVQAVEAKDWQSIAHRDAVKISNDIKHDNAEADLLLMNDARVQQLERDKGESGRNVQMAQATENMGPVALNQAILRQKNINRSEYMKNLANEFGAMSEDDLMNDTSGAYVQALSDYKSNRSGPDAEKYALRLSAVATELERRGKKDKLLDQLRDSNLALKGSNANDAIVLNTFRASESAPLSQYGITRMKSSNAMNEKSFSDFETGKSARRAGVSAEDVKNAVKSGTIETADADMKDSLAYAFSQVGDNVLVNSDKDIMNHIDGTNSSAVTNDQLFNYALNAKKDKDRAAGNAVIFRRMQASFTGGAAMEPMNIRSTDLTKLKMDTAQALTYTDASTGVTAVNADLHRALMDLASNPANARYISAMDGDTRRFLASLAATNPAYSAYSKFKMP